MSQLFQTISPVDGSILLERPFFSDHEIEKCLNSAELAMQMWQKTPLSVRQDICNKAVQYMVKHSDEIGEELTWQMGRPIRYTPNEIKGGFQERARHMVQIAPDALEDITVSAKEGYQRFIRKQPHGTVLILAPWNYPYLTAVNGLVPALLAGNCVILKHATQTPLCAERLAYAFKVAGVPEGVLQHMHLNHDQVSKVTKDRRIGFVCFTGSVKGGAAIEKSIAGRFKGSGMELGGKDPAYVRNDADLLHSIEQLVDGSFFNSGQSCCGIERIYVHRDVYRDFVDGFVGLTNNYTLDDPLKPATTIGPVVRLSAKRVIQAHIDEALAKGAQCLVNKNAFKKADPETPYMAPEVLIDVNHSMMIMKEETFGPVVGIMQVDNDEEAIRLMNDSRYGLTASIWTQEQKRAVEIANQVDTGTVFMNRCDYLDPELAWTGVKDSGRGCTLSTLGFDALTRPKSYHLKQIL